LIVDSVSEVFTLQEENIVELPPDSFGLSNRYVKSFGKVGNDVVLMLNCKKLFSDDDFTSISELL